MKKDTRKLDTDTDTWTPLGRATATLLMKLSGQAQPDAPHEPRPGKVEIACDNSDDTKVEVRAAKARRAR